MLVLKNSAQKETVVALQNWGGKTTSAKSAHKGQKKKGKVHNGQKDQEFTMEKEINNAQRGKEKETNSAQLQIKRSLVHNVYFVQHDAPYLLWPCSHYNKKKG